MCTTLLETGEDLQARGRMIYMHDLAKHVRQLLDCDLIAIRTKQDQVFSHENTYNVRLFPLVDGNPTVPLRVYLLGNLPVYHRVDVQTENVIDGYHDLTDRYIAQLKRRAQYLPLLILNHLHLLLYLKELFHFSLGHDDTDLLAEHFIQNCSDGIGENKSYNYGNP